MSKVTLDASEYEGKYLLKCRKCSAVMWGTDENGKVHTKKPKGLRLSDLSCPKCGGKMGEATLRKCYTCKTPRVVLVRESYKEASCPTCGDEQGYARYRILDARATTVREIVNGAWEETEL